MPHKHNADRRHPDHVDSSRCVQDVVAAAGKSDGIDHYAYGPDDLSAGLQQDQSPGRDVAGSTGL